MSRRHHSLCMPHPVSVAGSRYFCPGEGVLSAVRPGFVLQEDMTHDASASTDDDAMRLMPRPRRHGDLVHIARVVARVVAQPLPRPSTVRCVRPCSSSIGQAGTPACICACPHCPEHVHLLFLPPYSPKLQPAEHLWTLRLLTNTALVNQHFATSDDLEDAQFGRCAALQRQCERIRSTTLFDWWPKQIHKRRGPKRK